MGDLGTEGPPAQLAPPAQLRPLGPAWTSHRAVATIIVVVAALLPAALALVVTTILASDWTRPPGVATTLVWWLALTAVAWVVIHAAHVVTRRLFPLATLLHMGLAFPGTAPSRFRLALAAGSTRRFERSLPTRDGLLDDDVTAAGLMLELVSDLSDHDRSTRGHSERVRAYTELLATELGISADDRQRLRWAGLLHDIGKLETPAEILNKPGSLTEAEFDRIRQHPLDGLRLAMPLWAWLGDNVLAVSDHHERWEGGGYPSGVAGTDISTAGRIVAVADAFDVMTSSRSYKAPIPLEDARAELVRCAGTQFDPEVVRAFLTIDLRELRRVAGVLALFAPIPAVFRQVAPLSTPLRNAIGAATVAGAVVAWSVVTPFVPGVEVRAPQVLDDQVRAPGPGVDASPPGAPADPDDADPQTVDGPRTGDDRNGIDVTRAPRPPLDPTAPTPTPPDPVTPDPGAPPRPGTPPPRPTGPDRPEPNPPPAPRGDPVGIIVDPDAGSVDLQGVTPGGPMQVVALPAVGGVTCDGLGVCERIEVVLPITLFPQGTG